MTTSSEPVARFDHITIAASGIDAATEHYTALFGAAPSWHGSHPELGTESALFGFANALVEITAPHPTADEADALRQWIATTGEGLQAVAFGTDDAAKCSATLRARGVRATPPQTGEAKAADGSTRVYQTVDLSPRVTRGLPVLIVERGDFDVLTHHNAVAPDAVHALDHVVIRTADVAAFKGTFGTALGIRLALERELNGARMLFFRVGGVTLEVIEDRTAGDHDAFYGAAYRVRDLQSAHRRIVASGFDASEIRVGHKPGTHVFTVRDRTHGVATLMLHDPSRA